MDTQPTVFHITHHKAGSQWVAEVLKYCAPDRIILPKIKVAHFREDPIKPGGIYPAVYGTKAKFDRIMGASGLNLWRGLYRRPRAYGLNWWNFQFSRKPYIKFVIIRDLRDTLVSAYLSIKNSHPMLTTTLATWRKILHDIDEEQGLLFLMDEMLGNQATIQVSWIHESILLLRYETLLADEHTVFEQIINYCRIDVDRRRLHEIVDNNSFEAVTSRKRGQEDVNAHQRKGIVGDWRNHFSEHVKEKFKERFGNVLIKTGYEHDLNW